MSPWRCGQDTDAGLRLRLGFGGQKLGIERQLLSIGNFAD